MRSRGDSANLAKPANDLCCNAALIHPNPFLNRVRRLSADIRCLESNNNTFYEGENLDDS